MPHPACSRPAAPSSIVQQPAWLMLLILQRAPAASVQTLQQPCRPPSHAPHGSSCALALLQALRMQVAFCASIGSKFCSHQRVLRPLTVLSHLPVQAGPAGAAHFCCRCRSAQQTMMMESRLVYMAQACKPCQRHTWHTWCNSGGRNETGSLGGAKSGGRGWCGRCM